MQNDEFTCEDWRLNPQDKTLFQKVCHYKMIKSNDKSRTHEFIAQSIGCIGSVSSTAFTLATITKVAYAC